MQLIRQFELMAEEKYKMEGKIRGFFHAYVGQEAIAAGVKAGLTVQEAMAELLDADPANAGAIVGAAVAAAPNQAGAIAAFAISKGVSKTVAVQAALGAAPTQAQNIVDTVNAQTDTTDGILNLSSTGVSFAVTLTTGNTTTSVGGGGGCGRATCS